MIMLRSLQFHLRYFFHKKLRQTHRISHKSLEFICLIIGATFVSLFSFGFAKLSDLGLELNAHWSSKYPIAVWFVLPIGMACLAWFTKNILHMLEEAVFRKSLHQLIFLIVAIKPN